MQRGVEGLVGRQVFSEQMEGDCGGVDLGAEAGGFAEMSEVGGEAIADVDGGGGEPAAEKRCADFEARLRVEMWVRGRGSGSGWAVGGEQGGELGVGSTERAGDVEGVAGVCSGAAQGAARWSGADEDDVGEDEVGGGLGGIATGEGGVVLRGEGAETVEETFDPSLAGAGANQFRWEREREEGGDGGGSHGGEIAEATGEAAMAD